MTYTLPMQESDEKEVVMTEVKGNLHISNDVIADVIANSVIECYGVVGMSDPSASSVKILPQSRIRRGVTVSDSADGLNIGVFVVLEYGVNINVVSKNVRDRVTFVLNSYIQVPLNAVEVHVTGIKISR